jgi:PhnB protein
MPHPDAYLFFDGNCAEAMRFYESTLGGKLEPLMTYEQSPDGNACAGGAGGDRIMHAALNLDGRLLMASDSPPGQPHQPMGGFALSLFYPTPAEAKRTFERLSQGGKVLMPVDKTFWAEAFGMCVDRFGTPWMVSGGLQQPAAA